MLLYASFSGSGTICNYSVNFVTLPTNKSASVSEKTLLSLGECT